MITIANDLTTALATLQERPSLTVLAGGTDLMVETNFGHRQPSDVLAIAGIAELRSIDVADGLVRLGAGVTYTQLLHHSAAALVPALAQASRTVGSPQIRNAGTIGGNLGTASPAGDTLPVLAALDATVELASAAGTRSVPMQEFIIGVKRTVRQPGELITAVTIPVAAGWQGYAKVGVRNAMVISTAGVCLTVDIAKRSTCFALGSVAPGIVRPHEAEAWVAERVDWDRNHISESLAQEAGQRVAAAARPIDDHRSTAAYRRHAVAVLAARQLRRAFAGSAR